MLVVEAERVREFLDFDGGIRSNDLARLGDFQVQIVLHQSGVRMLLHHPADIGGTDVEGGSQVVHRKRRVEIGLEISVDLAEQLVAALLVQRLLLGEPPAQRGPAALRRSPCSSAGHRGAASPAWNSP